MGFGFDNTLQWADLFGLDFGDGNGLLMPYHSSTTTHVHPSNFPSGPDPGPDPLPANLVPLNQLPSDDPPPYAIQPSSQTQRPPRVGKAPDPTRRSGIDSRSLTSTKALPRLRHPLNVLHAFQLEIPMDNATITCCYACAIRPDVSAHGHAEPRKRRKSLRHSGVLRLPYGR